jgi:hypothetical protein
MTIVQEPRKDVDFIVGSMCQILRAINTVMLKIQKPEQYRFSKPTKIGR